MLLIVMIIIMTTMRLITILLFLNLERELLDLSLNRVDDDDDN